MYIHKVKDDKGNLVRTERVCGICSYSVGIDSNAKDNFRVDAESILVKDIYGNLNLTRSQVYICPRCGALQVDTTKL